THRSRPSRRSPPRSSVPPSPVSSATQTLAADLEYLYRYFYHSRWRRERSRQAELARDQHPLHLARPLTDLEDLGVPVEPPHGALVHETVAAEDLRRLPRVVHGGVRRGQLGDGRLLLERLTPQHLRRRLVVGQPRGVHARLHVGDLELDRLVRADRVAECLAFVRVPHALVDTALREPDAERGDRDPRSEERRVGKECRSRWSAYHEKEGK